MEGKSSNETNPSPDKSPSLLDSLLGVCFIGFVLYLVFLSCFPTDDKPKTEPTPPPPVEDWHGATNITEVVHRILVRLDRELEAYGIDGSNVVANAKANPQQLFRPVPESEKFVPRLRLLVLSDEDEAKIARGFVEECRNKRLLADDDKAGLARVRQIVWRLVPVVPQIADVPEVHLLRDDSVNACCLPDGTVFVNMGTLSKIQSDDLLAAILAHELGHAAARHGNEGISRALKAVAAGVALEEGMADLVPMLDSGKGVSLVRLVYGLGSAAAYTRPRDRRMETEADRLGTRYLARAGYNPEAMIRLFDWFAQIDPEEKPGFLNLFRTHPFNSERAEHVREVLLEPDLYEMPEAVSNKLARIATMGAKLASATNAVPISTNVLAKAKDVAGGTMGMVTNLWHGLPKLPFGKGKVEKAESR